MEIKGSLRSKRIKENEFSVNFFMSMAMEHTFTIVKLTSLSRIFVVCNISKYLHLTHFVSRFNYCM